MVVENVSARVNLNHILKLGVDDEINRIGECLSKVKLDTEVALFHKLKMITRAVIRGQVKAQSCVARAIITSIYLIACILGKLSSSTEKTLKSGYKILTASLTKFEKQGFSRYLFSVHIDTNLRSAVVFKVVRIGGICTIKCCCIHQY